MAVIVGAMTHPGQIRANNEDRYAVIVPPALPAGLDAVLAVADGMGGHQAGEVASGLVVERLAEMLAAPDALAPGVAQADPRVALERIIRDANQLILRTAAEDPGLRGMGTTATVIAVAGRRLYLGHVGDSRLYLIRDAAIRQLSNDHSWVAEQVRQGHLAPELAERHPQKNLLMRAIGSHDDLEIETEVFDLSAGDVLLLCSDGLTNVVPDAEILRLVQAYTEPKATAEKLTELANAQGAPDNVTVVVAQIVEPLAEVASTTAVEPNPAGSEDVDTNPGLISPVGTATLADLTPVAGPSSAPTLPGERLAFDLDAPALAGVAGVVDARPPRADATLPDLSVAPSSAARAVERPALAEHRDPGRALARALGVVLALALLATVVAALLWLGASPDRTLADWVGHLLPGLAAPAGGQRLP